MSRLYLLLFIVLVPSPAFAAVCLAGDGWTPFDFDGIPSNKFEVNRTGEITITSTDSSSFIIHPLSVDLGRTPYVSWRWRVDEAGSPTDLTLKGGDDRPIAVYVAFPYDSANASFGERMRRILVESSQGADAPGRTIAYVWGGKDPAGTRFQSPYTGRETQIVIVEGGDAPIGEWRRARVNPFEDYQSIYGTRIDKMQYIAVFADSDDTGVPSRSRIADICFSAKNSD